MSSASVAFERAVDDLLRTHRPSKHPFFDKLVGAGARAVEHVEFLDGLYRRYQSAMHATRVMIYHVPHLDAVDLRMAKLRILSDDDGLAYGDNHQSQLRRTWEYLMRSPPSLDDDQLAGLDALKTIVDVHTAAFISTVQNIYPLSLGPFVTIESMADEWIGLLFRAMKPHCRDLEQTDYFRENLFKGVEVTHKNEARRLASVVFERWPEFEPAAEAGALQMAVALNDFWAGCENWLEDKLQFIEQ